MIVNRIYQWARVQPAKTAVICNNARVSYAGFARSIDAHRRFFAQFEIAVGKTAVVLVDNLAHAWTTILALRSLGLTTIATKSVESAKLLRVRDVACIVCTQFQNDSTVLDSASFPDAKIIVIPNSILDDIHRGGIPHMCDDGIPFGDHIVYSSGSTGNSKMIRKQGKSELVWVEREVKLNKFDGASVHYGFDFPIWTAAGFSYPLAPWFTGGCMIFDQGNQKRENLFKHSVTHCFVTPLLLRNVCRLLKTPVQSDRKMYLWVGGGFLPYKDAKLARSKLMTDIHIQYGATELNSVRLASKFQSREDLDTLSPITDMVVETVDDNGRKLPIGQEGELRIQLEKFEASGYLGDEATTLRFFRDGFFYPGDMAVRLADGRVRILGRTADVLNIGGYKIAVAPIERAIQNTLRVDEVCVFMGLDNEGNDEIVVALQSDRLPEKGKLDNVAGQLPQSTQYRFLAIKQFPRTEGGMSKVKRSVLRQMVFRKPIHE